MYLYHASALALGGRFKRPFDEVIDAQAGVTLPITGGSASTRIENFNFKGKISFRSAQVEVTGHDVQEGSDEVHYTVTSAIVEGLNIINVVTADKVVARLASCHRNPSKEDEPCIITTGSYFENLKIAGHDIEIAEYAHDAFHAFDTYKKFQNGLKDGNSKQKVLDCMLGREIKLQDGDPQHLRDVHQGFKQHEGSKELKSTVLCSVVRKTNGMKAKEIRNYGPVVVVPQFGTVYLGELILSPARRRLNMLRLELGSPDQASFAAGTGDSNGGDYPPH